MNILSERMGYVRLYLVQVVAVVILPLLLGSNEVGSAEAPPPTREQLEVEAIHTCAETLLTDAGRMGPGTAGLPALYLKASSVKDREFMQYALAVMFVESKFQKNAVSPKEARGLMQMTEIAVLEASRGCGFPLVGNQEKMHDSFTNVKYGTCFLNLMLKLTDGNWKETLILYNGGFRQLSRYRAGQPMAQETEEYIIRVEEARNRCIKQKEV